jgi:hypothetical protein
MAATLPFLPSYPVVAVVRVGYYEYEGSSSFRFGLFYDQFSIQFIMKNFIIF